MFCPRVSMSRILPHIKSWKCTPIVHTANSILVPCTWIGARLASGSGDDQEGSWRCRTRNADRMHAKTTRGSAILAWNLWFALSRTTVKGSVQGRDPRWQKKNPEEFENCGDWCRCKGLEVIEHPCKRGHKLICGYIALWDHHPQFCHHPVRYVRFPVVKPQLVQ